jgi:hypothetical protein
MILNFGTLRLRSPSQRIGTAKGMEVAILRRHDCRRSCSRIATRLVVSRSSDPCVVEGYHVHTIRDGRELLTQIEYVMATRGHRVGGRPATESCAVVTSPELQTLSGLAVRECIAHAGWQIAFVVLPEACPADEGQIDSVRLQLLAALHADAPAQH